MTQDLITLLAQVDLDKPDTVKACAEPLRKWLDKTFPAERSDGLRMWRVYSDPFQKMNRCFVEDLHYENREALVFLYSLDALRSIRRPGWAYACTGTIQGDFIASCVEMKELQSDDGIFYHNGEMTDYLKTETAAILSAIIKSYEVG